MSKLFNGILVGFMLFFFVGCNRTVYNARRASPEELSNEGTIVFVRPDVHTDFGTRSIRDYIEVTYENISTNDAGYPVLKIGLRNRGGKHFWDKKGPDVQLSVQSAFYKRPFRLEGAVSRPAAYRTNWQVAKLLRGQSTDYKVTCPVKEATYYQVTISEFLK